MWDSPMYKVVGDTKVHTLYMCVCWQPSTQQAEVVVGIKLTPENTVMTMLRSGIEWRMEK